MSFQHYFYKFNQAITLTEREHYAHVLAVRDKVLSIFPAATPSDYKTFRKHIWGSYAMGTGIRPLPGNDYDIDIGLVYNLRPSDATPQDLKGAIYNSLESAGYNPQWMRPCIQIAFTGYHLDISVFTREGDRLFIAEGKQHDHRTRWRPDGMEWFVQLIWNHPNTEYAEQFRRIIRYLKRWKDIHFGYVGMKGPVGLALTVMAYRWYSPQADDLSALRVVVRQAVRYFEQRNMTLEFPYEPNDNLLRKMSNEQVYQMLGRFQQLSQWLDQAALSSRLEPLRLAFGTDFPSS